MQNLLSQLYQKLNMALTLKLPITIEADDILKYFPEKKRIDISGKLSAR